jgi:hypothetical protein
MARTTGRLQLHGLQDPDSELDALDLPKGFFSDKGSFINFQGYYIEMIQRLENTPGLCITGCTQPIKENKMNKTH